MDIRNKKIIIVGLGKSGLSASKVLTSMGCEISIKDDRTFEELGKEGRKFIEDEKPTTFLGREGVVAEAYDIVVVSPGVALDNPTVFNQNAKGSKVIGELELAYKIGKGSFIGITGTNGKTTTTSLVGEIFKKSKRDTRIVGNIGKPVVEEALRSNEETWFVTEVSSFQLETVESFKPKVAAILNLTPDHLDRHNTMENYGLIKARIAKMQDEADFLILNLDDNELKKINYNSKTKKVYFTKNNKVSLGTFIKDNSIYLMDEKGKERKVIEVEKLPLPGTHNLENTLAAVAICYFSGISIDVIKKGILSFQGVEHRVEIFLEEKGVKYVNDSKGTNSDATIKALEALGNNIHLLAGGYDKGGDYEEMLTYGKNRIKGIYLIGETKNKIFSQAKLLGYEEVHLFESLNECVEKAIKNAKEGDSVLLSPACASWDMYPNYEVRGREFKELVIENVKRRANES